MMASAQWQQQQYLWHDISLDSDTCSDNCISNEHGDGNGHDGDDGQGGWR